MVLIYLLVELFSSLKDIIADFILDEKKKWNLTLNLLFSLMFWFFFFFFLENVKKSEMQSLERCNSVCPRSLKQPLIISNFKAANAGIRDRTVKHVFTF